MAQSTADPPFVQRERPYFLTPEVERVLAISLTIAQELAVARARIDTLERLLERKGLVAQEEIETFQPTPPEAAAADAWLQEYVVRVLSVLQKELDDVRSGADPDRAAAPAAGTDARASIER